MQFCDTAEYGQEATKGDRDFGKTQPQRAQTFPERFTASKAVSRCACHRSPRSPVEDECVMDCAGKRSATALSNDTIASNTLALSKQQIVISPFRNPRNPVIRG